jgi:rod shape-determining protein MreC
MRIEQNGERRRGRSDFLVLLALLASSGIFSSLPEPHQARVAVALRSSALRPFLLLQESFVERARLRARYERLREERDSLVREVVTGRMTVNEIATLRGLLALDRRPEGNYVPADLFPGRPRVGDSDVFVLGGRGIGNLDPPVGVVNGDGLVGILRGTDENGALGAFWSHPDFRVSVLAAGTGVTGIVRPVRSEGGQAAMLLEGAPYQESIAPGIELLTTGLAGVFPPGIRVGTVREESDQESGWMRRYLIEPAVRPEDAAAVLVWRRPVMRGPHGVASGDTAVERRTVADSDTTTVPDA